MRALSLIFLCLLSLTARAGEFQLSSQCPASFEKRDGHCKLVSQYTPYTSLQNVGVGGLKTGLPALRDGFSAEEIDLGRFLFFDPVLSGNGKQSCASCHNPDKGFADGRALSLGATGKLTARSAPSLWNAGFLKRFFWDGRAATLEEQMKGPLYSPIEMGSSPEKILSSLNANKEYQRLFAVAYPANQANQTIRIDQVYSAIAAFESSLISLNSRYDLYAHNSINIIMACLW